jgi:bifunctional UDP-N-acetylglucosamine pyrophosphorylase/glucosamine-1-phosphate N-acetyltransferase
MTRLSVVILAAGKGTRMVSNRAKVLHKLCGRPMLRLIYDAAKGLSPDAVIVVVGQDADAVRKSLDGHPARFAVQKEQLGTGHAAMAAAEELAVLKGDVVVLFGDTPRVRTETLAGLVTHHRSTGADMTLLTATMKETFPYGRIVRDVAGRIEAIVEEKDATAEQRALREINPGFYCFRIPALLEGLHSLDNSNAQHEYYITDLVAILRRDGRRVETLPHADFQELRGINNREELADLARSLGREKKSALMAAGVTLVDPDHTYIDLDVTIERDAIIYPNVTLEGTTHIGEGSVIRPGTRIADSRIGPNVEVLDACLITGSEIGRGTTVGPCARLRDHAVVGEGCRIGNFVEIKKSTLGDGVKAAHLAYLGDATLGRNVNIGAGTITCNFDGYRKNATIIEDDVFIGSDCQLIAPVRVGRGAYVAAGSTIVVDVPAGALGIARGRQQNKEGWVGRRRPPGSGDA